MSADKNSFLKSSRNPKPYDKNQSFLNKVKSAVSGYLTPSWVKAVISPSRDPAPIDRNNDQLVKAMELEREEHPTSSREIVTESVSYERRSPTSEEFALVERLPSLKRRVSQDRLDSLSGLSDGLSLEPQSKRKALDRSVEFIQDRTVDDLLKSRDRVSRPIAGRPSIGQNSSRQISSIASNKTPSRQGSSKPSNTSLYSLSQLNKTQSNALATSPFYNGPITYGGANACSSQQMKSSIAAEVTGDHCLLISKKSLNPGLSTTTQKILKVLEKRTQESGRIQGLPTLTLDPKRRGFFGVEDGSNISRPPVKQLVTPGRVTIKPNYALMNFKKRDADETTEESLTTRWTGKIRRERGKLHHTRNQEEEEDEEKTDCPISQNKDEDLCLIKLPPIKMVPFSAPSSLPLPVISSGSKEFKFSLPLTNPASRRITDDSKAQTGKFVFSQPTSSKTCSPSRSTSQAILGPTSSAESIVKATLSTFDVDFSAAIKKSSPKNTDGLKVAFAKEMKQGSVMDALKNDIPASVAEFSSTRNETKENSLKELFKAKSNDAWSCPTCMVSNKSDLSSCPCCTTTRPSPQTSAANISASASSTKVASQPTISLPTHGVDPIKKPVPNGPTGINDSLSALFAAKPGEWTCDTCMVRNKSGVDKCAACETARPGSNSLHCSNTASATVGQASQQKPKCPKCGEEIDDALSTCRCSRSKPDQPENQSASTNVPDRGPTSSLSALFGAKPGEWTCDTCMIKNQSDVDKCAACETAKPGSNLKDASGGAENKEDSKAAAPLVSFKAGGGGFTFGTGVAFNASDFGNKSTATSEIKSFGATQGGFKPSFGSLKNATSSSGVGSACPGGGFQFSLTASQSLPVTSNPPTSSSAVPTLTFGAAQPVQSSSSLPVLAPTTILSSLQNKNVPNGMTTLTFGQTTHETSNASKDSGSCNSNGLPDAKPGGFSFITKVDSESKPSDFPFKDSLQGSSNQPTSKFIGQQKTSFTPFQIDKPSGIGDAEFSFKPQQNNASSFQLGSASSTSGKTNQPFVFPSMNSTTNQPSLFPSTNSATNQPSFFSSVSSSANQTFFSSSTTTTNNSSIFSTTISTANQPFQFQALVNSVTQPSLFPSKNGSTNQISFPPVSSVTNKPFIFQSKSSVSTQPSIFSSNVTSQPSLFPSTTRTSNAFGQNLFPATVSTVGQGMFPFDSLTSSKNQQASSLTFGQTAQSSSIFAAPKNAAAPQAFGFGATRLSSNGDDMVTESPQPQPQQPPFPINNPVNKPDFGFGSSGMNSGSNLFGTQSTQPSQGFSFKAPPTFNFSQTTPNYPPTQQVPSQPWGQPPQQPNVAQPFVFNSSLTPVINFIGSADPSNMTFSMGSSPAQGGRVIKKAARRMKK